MVNSFLGPVSYQKRDKTRTAKWGRRRLGRRGLIDQMEKTLKVLFVHTHYGGLYLGLAPICPIPGAVQFLGQDRQKTKS
jgi:hypothetical protein